MMVMVAVPEGMGPGQQLQVDPDGPAGPLPPVTVTVRALSCASGMPAVVSLRRTMPVVACPEVDCLLRHDRSPTALVQGSSSRCRFRPPLR
jgi:hypothetical protein